MRLRTRFPGVLALAAFLIAVALGAGNFIAVGFSNRGLDPFWGAGFRFGLAALIFVGIAMVRRLRWPRGRDLWLTVAYGALGTGVFFALMYWARLQVGAGVATIVMAIVPVATLGLAVAQGLESWRPRGIGGALLACAGIGWIAIGSRGADLPVGALAAMIVAALAVSQSVVLGKRLSGNHPVVTNAVAMIAGAVLLLALSAAAGEKWALPREREVALALGYLVLLGTAALFVLILLLVRRWTASAASYMFVLFPVVTMALDALLFAEEVTARELVGGLAVMTGVWFGALSPAARRPVKPAEPPIPEPRTKRQIAPVRRDGAADWLAGPRPRSIRAGQASGGTRPLRP